MRIRDITVSLIIWLLFCIPGLAFANADGLSLESVIYQDSTVTPTDTATATATLTVTENGQTATASPTLTITVGSQTFTATHTATTATGDQTTTATLTGTVTPTAGTGQSTVTISPTASPTEEIGETPVLTVTQVVTPTATLLPFPSVTFIYPQRTDTPVLSSALRLPGDQAFSKTGPGLLNWARLLMCGFILVLWILLAAWFFIAHHKIE